MSTQIRLIDMPGVGPIGVRQNIGPLDRATLWPSVGEYPVYDDFFYQVMLEDDLRNKLFEDAIADVCDGARVLEVGTGPDLLWTRRALTHGAKHVTAVEEDTESFQKAQAVAAQFGDRLTLIHGRAENVSLGDRANVCIMELVGAIAGSEGIEEIGRRAREKVLTGSPVFIPSRLKTAIGGVHLRAILGRDFGLSADAIEYTAQVIKLFDSPFDVRMCVRGLKRSDLATSTGTLEDIHLGSGLSLHPDSIELRVTRRGIVDALICWLQMEAGPNSDLLDSLEETTNWSPVIVAFHESEPLEVQVGDYIELKCWRSLVREVYPEWTFTAALRRDGSIVESREANSPYGATQAPFRSSWLHRHLFETTV